MTNTRPLAGAGPGDGNFRHVTRPLSGARRAQGALPLAPDRELLRRRQPARSRPDALHRRRLDGRSHVAVGARPAQPAGADDVPAAGLPALLPAPRRRASRCTTRPTWRSTRAAGCPASSALSFPPDSLDERDIERVRDETDRWKALRGAAADGERGRWFRRRSRARSPGRGTARCSSRQAWNQAVLYAFQNDRVSRASNLRMRGLDRAVPVRRALRSRGRARCVDRRPA